MKLTSSTFSLSTSFKTTSPLSCLGCISNFPKISKYFRLSKLQWHIPFTLIDFGSLKTLKEECIKFRLSALISNFPPATILKVVCTHKKINYNLCRRDGCKIKKLKHRLTLKVDFIKKSKCSIWQHSNITRLK